MARTYTLLFVSFAALGMAPLTVSAEQMDKAEIELFRAGKISLQDAGQAALAAHSGTLAAVGFGDENGRGVYEAVVISADGTPWTVKLDATTGQVLLSGQTDLMDEDDAEASAGKQGDDDGDVMKVDDETNDG